MTAGLPPTRTRGSTYARAASLLLALVVPLAATNCADARTRDSASTTAQRSGVWKRGTRWTVTVLLNSGAVAPGGSGTTYRAVYRFRVHTAPKRRSAAWRIHADLDGAQGLQARGFTLYYKRQRGRDAFLLTGVALRGDDPQPVEYAPFVLGRDFPLQRRVTRTPRSHTIDRR